MKAGATSRALAFEAQWKAALSKGHFVGASLRPFGALTVRPAETVAAFPRNVPARPLAPDNLEMTFAVDPKLYDGRHANNAWLLELPDPMSKLVWDNAALVLARHGEGARRGERRRRPDRARRRPGSIEIPAWILPGQADNTDHPDARLGPHRRRPLRRRAPASTSTRSAAATRSASPTARA